MRRYSVLPWFGYFATKPLSLSYSIILSIVFEWTTYKAFVAVFQGLFPDEPFYGFDIWEWFNWLRLLDPTLLFIFHQSVMVILLNRRTERSIGVIVVFGILMGAYGTLLFGPFNGFEVMQSYAGFPFESPIVEALIAYSAIILILLVVPLLLLWLPQVTLGSASSVTRK